MSDNVLAGALACADARVQADFFNEFCSTLKAVCKGREGSQLWHIAEKLDQSTAEMFKELAETRAYHKAEYVKDTLRRDELRQEIWKLEEQRKALAPEEP